MSDRQASMKDLIDNLNIPKNAFLFSYWVGPGGYLLWLYKSNNELFAIMCQGNGEIIPIHWPYKDHDQIEAFGKSQYLLGFVEHSVYAELRDISQAHVSNLVKLFGIVQATRAERQKAKEESTKMVRPVPDGNDSKIELVKK